jgi:6-phosphogluconolactonase (cycloisomerase 2 family)
MKLSRIGRVSMAFVVSVAMGLGMTACGGGTIGFMWVLGTQYNQIAAFKIDDFSGNLTQVLHSPFTSGGANPVSLVVSTGGRFVYVVNQGLAQGATLPAGSESLPCGTTGGVAEFSVGGQGVLTFQQCFQVQGSTPVWATKDSTGSFLYVLSQQAPALPSAPANAPPPPYGAITVFSIASDTGRLSLIVNQQVKDPATQQQLTYFPVGNTPTMLTVAGSCVFTLNSGTQAATAPTVFPYAVGTAGQLTQTANSTISINATRPTSILAGGNNSSVQASSAYVYITDAGAQNTPGQILPFTVGTSPACSLNTVTGGPVANLPTTSNPIYTLVDSTGKYLYVANQSSTNSTVANSTVSGFNIQSNGQLQGIPDGSNNPYAVGGAPVCMAEDPSNQYLYTSNGNGTVTGKILDRSTGRLSDLSRGSLFTAVGQATCLAVSGNVD